MSKNELLQEQIQTIQKMLKKPENRLCADCKRPSPSWASINLGVFVCINCSGCHREIGVHVTKIKSINLDLWDKKILKYFKKINNKIANKYWEYHLKNFDFKKIQKDNYLCQDFIRDKYERKKWIKKKKKDPMSLIIAGKFKNDSSDEEENENEEEEEEEEKEKKNEKKNKKKKEKSDDEDSIDNDNNDNDDEFQEVEDNNNNIINNNNYINNKRPNLGLKIDLVDLNSQSSMSQRGPSKNIFNTMQNISSNNNLLDFNEVTQQDQKSNNLLNNIQQAYQTPINNNYNNRTVVNNQNNNFGIYNNNINMNNNTMNMNNNNMFSFNNNMMMNMNNGFNNFGMNNQFSNNGFINNNGNNMINMNNNFNNKPQNNQINTQPAFNMEYFQKELNQSKTNKNSSNFVLDLGSNSTRKVKDPFSNLVNFN